MMRSGEQAGHVRRVERIMERRGKPGCCVLAAEWFALTGARKCLLKCLLEARPGKTESKIDAHLRLKHS